MMKLVILVLGYFSRRKSAKSAYDDAVSEGIRDTFREMGYSLKDVKSKK
jgi:hypothetical protein